MTRRGRFSISISVVLALFSGCNNQDTQSSASCPSVSGTPWVPNVPGAGAANHDDSSVQTIKNVYNAQGNPLTGLADPVVAGSANIITISNIDMGTDLLTGGSISLVAQTQNFPSSDLSGGAWPVLVSLSDGTHEWVNMQGQDSNGSWQPFCPLGFYSCTSGTNGSCNATTCGPDPQGTLGSVFLGATPLERRGYWEQGQRVGTSDYVSVNVFPNCDWTSAPTGEPTCPFTMSPANLMGGTGKLPAGSGVTYTAKYVLLASDYESVSGYSADLKLTVVRKKDGNLGSSKGAVDLNVILVGSKNIQDSHTDKGQQNLDALFSELYNQYLNDNPSSTDIKLGKISVYEWNCGQGGDSYASVNINDTGKMFSQGSTLVDPASEGKAVNLFLVSSIDYQGAGTVLGLSGGIPGAAINGTNASGLVVSTFDDLGTFNANCSPGSPCPLSMQDSSFLNLEGTVSHEMGHFFGLNHPSESAGTQHDRIPDTPRCTTVDSGGYITISSCRSEAACNAVCSATQYATNPFCPTASQCQFNDIMWWTEKNYNGVGQGDGNLFSPESGDVINYNSYVQ